ncbi:MAG TPA: RepB family plasmid replication initiator protein [Patescibacteria group bacterium]|nr:RepB family plasmid replication initiator protein [Patescibacteria group bacterium]
MSCKDIIKTRSDSIDMRKIFEIIKDHADKNQPILEFTISEFIELFGTEVNDIEELSHIIFTMQYVKIGSMRSITNIFTIVEIDEKKIKYLINESLLEYVEKSKVNFDDIEVKIVIKTQSD